MKETNIFYNCKTKKQVSDLATKVSRNGLSTSDKPVEAVSAQRNTNWPSFKKCNCFKQLKKKNLGDTNEIEEKGTGTADTLPAPVLITISANNDNGGPTKVNPQSEKRGIFRLRIPWKMRNAETNDTDSLDDESSSHSVGNQGSRHQLSFIRLGPPRDSSLPKSQYTPTKKFRLFSSQSKKRGQRYEELVSFCSSTSSLHSKSAVSSEDKFSVASTVTCGYPIYSRDGNFRWIHVGNNMDYIKEECRNASSFLHDTTHVKNEKASFERNM